MIRIGGSALALAALAVFLPVETILDALRRVPAWAWAVAIPLYLSLHLLGAAKWRLLVNAGGGGLDYPDAVRCYYAGLFGSTFLPSIVGGDVVRAGLGLRLAESRGGVILGSLVDRAVDIVALTLVAGAGILLVPRALDPRARGTYLTLLALLVGVGLAVAALIVLLPARRFPYRIRRLLARGRRTVRTMRRRPDAVLVALGTGVVLQSCLVVLNAALGWLCGVQAPLHVWFFVWPLAKISALVPATQGGIGVREAALAVLFAPFGVPAALAVAAGLVFQGVVLSGGLAAGAISLLAGRFRVRRAAAGLSPGGSAGERTEAVGSRLTD